jgi:uncharacterized phage protein gp47/JayE
MADLPTRIDLFNLAADEVLNRSAVRAPGQRLNPDEVFTEGSDINIVLASASAMAEEVLRQLALKISALFLDTAEGEDLDRLVGDRYSPTVVRKQATPSVATVTFTRASGAFPAITLPAETKLRTAGGVEFRTRFAVSLGSGSAGPVSVEVQASEAGTVGNVAAFTIVQFVEQPADPNMLVSNAEPAAGGDDIETDARLRERARQFYQTAQRGTLAAIEFGALTVAGVRQATAVEERDSNGDETGRVQLYIADAQGQGNTALVNAVLGALLEYRAAGVVVDVVASTPVFVPIRFRLRFASGVDSTEAFASIQLATLAAVNALSPQQTLEVSLLFQQARTVPGVIVLDDAIVAPVGDVVPAAGQVLRTTLDLITAE